MVGVWVLALSFCHVTPKYNPSACLGAKHVSIIACCGAAALPLPDTNSVRSGVSTPYHTPIFPCTTARQFVAAFCCRVSRRCVKVPIVQRSVNRVSPLCAPCHSWQRRWSRAPSTRWVCSFFLPRLLCCCGSSGCTPTSSCHP